MEDLNELRIALESYPLSESRRLAGDGLFLKHMNALSTPEYGEKNHGGQAALPSRPRSTTKGVEHSTDCVLMATGSSEARRHARGSRDARWGAKEKETEDWEPWIFLY